MKADEQHYSLLKGESSDEDGEEVQYRAPGHAGGGGAGEKVVDGAGDDVEGGFGEKVGRGGGGGGRRSEYRGGDYYEFIARAPSIRPICVAEGEGLSEKNSSSLAYWWATTFLKFLSIIILSVRTDRLSDSTYLASHWKHYGGMLAFALVAWLPQVCDSLGLVYFSLSPSTAYIACIFGLFYYILSISFYFLHLAPWLRNRLGTATTLRIWEYYVSVAWQVQTLGFWALTICPLSQTSVDVLAPIPTWVTTGVGLLLVVFGIGSKMGAIYGTGYNTYYWYDMVTEIPNAYFVEVGIYKWHGSPTYTLGRGTSFGAALHYRSVPMLFAAIADLVLINIFNRLVEQPFVRRKYLSSPSTA